MPLSAEGLMSGFRHTEHALSRTERRRDFGLIKLAFLARLARPGSCLPDEKRKTGAAQTCGPTLLFDSP
jgi:hypothetical protein